MALNTPANRLSLIRAFPALQHDVNFKILSEQTNRYNCIAWAMGYTDRWVDHLKIVGHWWPSGVIRSQTSKALIDAFKAVGFIMADDYNPEINFRKVILYKNFETDTWTHASLVVTDKIEHSKFGPQWNGQHSHSVLNSDTDQSYGQSFAYMKRPLGPLPEQELTGTISVDATELVKMMRKLESLTQYLSNRTL